MPDTFDAAAYVEQAQATLGLPICPDYQAGVIENVQVLAEIADFVTQFPLPDSIESAPRFEPMSDAAPMDRASGPVDLSS